MKQDSINIILMHGKNTDPSQKWYPWLKLKMLENNISFISPILPNSDDPEINAWIDELKKTKPDNRSILIWHSRGGVAILRFLEKQEVDFRVKKVILVATNSGKSEKRNKTENNRWFFTARWFDFNEIKTHCDNFIVFHSKDDDWVPFEDWIENTKWLNARLIEFNDKWHFGNKLEKQEIPELLDEIIYNK